MPNGGSPPPHPRDDRGRPVHVQIRRAVGVELGGVSVYLSEIATPGNRGFYTSFQSSSQQVAIFVAAIIGFILREAMPADTFLDSIGGIAKWRIPFFVGCIIIPVIFFLRRTLEETPEFLAMKKHPTASEVFASAIAFWIQTYAQQRLPASRAALILTTEPAFTVFFAFLLVGERFRLLQAAGAASTRAACVAAAK